MKRHECTDPFLRGYLDAALFTTDQNPPSGWDYVESGRSADMFESLPDYFLEQARKDCAAFEEKAAAFLPLAGDYEQNGHDFWLTRNHYGAGFWDRGYDEPIGDKLTEIAHSFGEHDLCPDEIGQETEE